MITDLTSQGARYATIHPVFRDAFTFLNSAEPTDLPVGAHDRGAFTAVVVDTDGWRPRALCTPDGDFDPGKDIGFVKDRPELWIPVPPGRFAAFFPDDGHAPLASDGPLRKLVLKIPDAPR